MSNTIKLKRSNVPGKVPTLAQLTAGELAMNTNDEKLFFSSGTNVIEVAHQSQVSTLASEIATKLNASDYTALDILAKLITVDGHTSGLNADMLDGHHYTDFQLQSIELDAIVGLTGTNGFLKKTGAGTYTLDTNSYVNVDLLNQPNGVATLDATGKVFSSQLPSYVDDVLEFVDFASFPITGETSKIYIALDTNKIYRWSGTIYVDISSTGLADAALKLNTARSISATGDATWSVNFDGSANVTSAITLASVVTGATAAKVTFNDKGLITGTSTLAASDIPDLDWAKITTGKPTTYSGYGITDVAPLSHISDASLHLTSTQNTWIDAITATSTEVNYLVGVTSAIQTQLNSKEASNSKLTSISGLNNTTTGLLKFTNGVASYDTNAYAAIIAGSGLVLQTKYATVAPQSGTTLIPFNATPTTANGTQIASITLSLSSISSLVEIDWSSFIDTGTNNKTIACAIFRGNTCVYTTASNVATSNRVNQIVVTFVDAPASTGNVTYSLRVGADSAATWYLGQASNGNTYTNVSTTTVTIRELA